MAACKIYSSHHLRSNERRRKFINGKNRKMIALHWASHSRMCSVYDGGGSKEKKPEVVSRPSRRAEHAKEQHLR